MAYTVYVIKSRKTGKHYVGYTGNLEKRLKEHRSCKTRSTKSFGLFDLIYREELPTRQEAYRRERKIKSYKGGKAFKMLLT